MGSQRGHTASSSVMIPVGKYLPPLTLARCHNDSLCVALCSCVRLCVCVAAQSPTSPPLPSPPPNIPSLQLQLTSLINNASFILEPGLTLAAFCLLPGARVRMYRLKKQGYLSLSLLNKKKGRKKAPLERNKEFPLNGSSPPPATFQLIA